jgi:hypothetical protein
MARIARVVVPNFPHHITLHSNRRRYIIKGKKSGNTGPGPVFLADQKKEISYHLSITSPPALGGDLFNAESPHDLSESKKMLFLQ